MTPANTKSNLLDQFRPRQEVLASLVGGYNADPFAVLGPHYYEETGKKYLVIRAFLPSAGEVQVKTATAAYPMEKTMREGLFEVLIIEPSENFSYTLLVRNFVDQTFEFADAYAFGSTLSEFDLHLIGEGNHYRTYEKLGAHLREIDGVKGVAFAVWSPNALRVSVVGDFNQWDGRVLPMRSHPNQGIWEIFVPNVGEGFIYKYEIKSRFNNYMVTKTDPYGFFGEVRPQTASVVADLDKYQWQDNEWIESGRAKANALAAPIAVYEVHLGSWRRRWGASSHDESYLTYRELAEQLPEYVKNMGFTHVEFMPVAEHPFDGSWGYQVTGYYSVTSRYGTPEDFMYLVDKLHQNGIGVIMDWVPAHFPKDQHGLGYFDGTHLYEHSDPRQGEHLDWGTYIFNYGRNEVRNYLLSNALFWLDKYHIDGMRVDAVASMLYLNFSRPEGQWLPNKYGGNENLEAIDFLKRFNEVVHLEFPATLTSAEDSTDWPLVTKPTYMGGLGFDLKWNMGWMNDTLKYMKLDPIFRRYHHNSLTFSLMYAFTEHFILPISHDEVVHLKHALLDKMPGDVWQKFANLRTFLTYMWTHPGKKLLFMGAEIGQWNEWNERTALQWELLDHPSHKSIQNLMVDLNNLYKNEASLHQVDYDWKGFEWVEVHDSDNSTLVYLRRAKDSGDELTVVLNFTPVVRQNYRIGATKLGFYAEVLNTDSEIYWGSNVGNSGGVWAENVPCGNFPHTLSITIPPLAAVIFRTPQ
jgi:1,4-alpha-glucan branching enzyme